MNRRDHRLELTVLAILTLGILVGCGGGGGSNSSGFTGNGGGTNNGPSALVISSTSMPGGISGKPYTFTFTASGGTPPYTWGVTPGYSNVAGAISADGVFSGTIPQGNWGIAVTVSDSGSPKQTRSSIYSLSVYPELVITTSSLPASHTNIPYDEIVQADNVKAWTVTSGQLPPGIQLLRPIRTQVELSGTATQTGNFNFTIQADSLDGPSQTATKTFTIAVDDNPAISTTQLLDVIHNLPYQDSLQAVNGIPPYHWSLQSGAMPAGLGIDSDTGVISGTYSASVYQGVYNPVFQVTDSSNPPRSGSRTVTMYLLETLNVSVCADATTPISQPYYQNLSRWGGRQPYTWTMTAGALPPGLNFSNGSVGGIPTQMGVYNYTLHVQDSSNPAQIADRTCKLTVTPPQLILGNSLPGQIPLGVAFQGFQSAQGGTPPYKYTLINGSLPAGLGLDASTGEIKGVPITLGTSTFTIRVTDSASSPQIANLAYTMVVVKPLGRNDSIQKATLIGNGATLASVSPYADPADVVNPDTDYYQILADAAATVEVKAYHQSDGYIIDPVLELLDANGARLNVCNQPSDQYGNYKGTFTGVCLNDDITDGVVRDSALQMKVPGNPGTQTALYAHVLDWRGDARPDMVYSLYVFGAVDPLKIGDNEAPHNTAVGIFYQVWVSVTGGTGIKTMTVDSGSLPPGLTLDSSGYISGTTTTTGSYPFTLKVTDSATPPQVATHDFTIIVAYPAKITTTSLPAACINTPYSFTPQATGGVPPYIWSWSSFPPVPGINWDGFTATLSGTPTAAGTYTGAFFLNDNGASSDSKSFTLEVKPSCP